MRRADFTSDAEYYRAHRKVFLLAQELGCTPIDAERWMKDQATRMRQLAAQARLDAKQNPPSAPAVPTPGGAPAWDAPWMMQE
ncbi:MAG: hypothetical protein J0I69_02935 [Altererythrobacter sp.]|nr:hypothetical protein [Altererythrobacter sp.]OJU60967.1 MAG: hypothetical protein BGO08_12650 [Altererythrobacter sp. 66-12]